MNDVPGFSPHDRRKDKDRFITDPYLLVRPEGFEPATF